MPITRTPERVEFLTDLLVTAVEGGVGYWSYAERYVFDGPAEARGVTLTPNGDFADEDPDFPPTRVTLDDLARALGKIRRREVELNEHLRQTIVDIDRTNNGETGELRGEDMDAVTADIVCQVACLGEVVYS